MNEQTRPMSNIPAAVEAGRARGRRMRAAIPQLAARSAAARERADAALARVPAPQLTTALSRLDETVSGSVQPAPMPVSV